MLNISKVKPGKDLIFIRMRAPEISTCVREIVA